MSGQLRAPRISQTARALGLSATTTGLSAAPAVMWTGHAASAVLLHRITSNMATKTVIEFSISELNRLRRLVALEKAEFEMPGDPPDEWRANEELEDKLNNALVDLVNSGPIDKEMFIEATGAAPQHDDLERCNCRLREPGHSSCGWCVHHWKPRFVCGCPA